MQLTVRIKPMILKIRLGGGQIVPDIIAIFRNDLEPDLEVEFVDVDPVTKAETPSDMTGYTSLVLEARPLDTPGGALQINAALTPVNAAQGRFKYVWQTADTDTAIIFKASITGVKSGSRQRTLKQFELHILEDLP